jgi:hypothetical protein
MTSRSKILEEVIKKCLDNNLIKDELLFIALLGSSQTDEAVEGYSDLDILLILKSNNSGAIKNQTLLELKHLTETISKKTDIELSLLTHTVFDFEEYVDFNYLLHYSWGKVLFGNESDYQKLFTSIIDKKYSEKARKDLTYYNLVHARFNLIRQCVSWNKYNKSNYQNTVLKLLIDKIIEICDWALAYRGIFMKNKKEILSEFHSNFPLKECGHIPSQAYEIRSKWNSNNLSEKELNIFIDESLKFVQELVKIIHKEHVKN